MYGKSISFRDGVNYKSGNPLSHGLSSPDFFRKCCNLQTATIGYFIVIAPRNSLSIAYFSYRNEFTIEAPLSGVPCFDVYPWRKLQACNVQIGTSNHKQRLFLAK
tara:strand:+ start:1331 stop:1645 length:315 start_codon:yes stop_codon:yes gene_type:complete